MSTAARILHQPVAPSRIPSLQQGDRLTRDEFERRFDATPGLKRAELIEGRVYVPPPVSHSGHSRPHGTVLAWLGTYAAATPGTDFGSSGSVRMDLDNMPQPDAYLLIDPKHGGQARISADDYVEGAPDLVVEVSHTTASYDLHDKFEVYRRNGVREYIVWRTFDEEIDYFILRNGLYERHAALEAGRFRSEVFPGLWLDAKSLLAGDLAAVLAFVQQGIASPAHADFVARLAAAAKPG
jgi:Uma2 family endonuclease